jgi:polyphosphate kinase
MCAEPARASLEIHFPDLHNPALYLNRELSHLEFQRRVLEEARDPRNPLLERAKFLSILGSNLDEFFMVRVAGLMQQIENDVHEPGIDGRSPAETLEAIRTEVDKLMEEAYDFLRERLLPALRAANIHLVDLSAIDSEQRAQLDSIFIDKVFPVLTPLAFDPGRPFPHISNLSLNLAVVVRDAGGQEHFARVKVPDSLPKFLPVNLMSENSLNPRVQGFVPIEQLLIANLHHLFPGLEIVQAHLFHVTRDAEVAIKELETDDLLETIEEAVWQRRFRDAVRLQVDVNMPPSMVEILANNLEVEAASIYTVDGLLDLSRLRHLISLDRPDLKDKPFAPATPPGFGPKDDDMFGLIRKEDQLLHHPYDSFQPVVEFLRKAAKDPDVLAIKMTLYRMGGNSPVVAALLEAVENGKQVAVLVELKARFDEESNIEWARALEREGVHVVYGLLGLKVHSKVTLIVRREGEQIRRYCHLATGNYNPVTARLYTDLGLFTSNELIGADATDLFNYLTGYSNKKSFRKLLVAPLNLRQRFEAMIEREIDVQRNGGQGHLIFKTNALEDGPLIRLLYQASQAGVQVDLIVRGACCLRPALAGVSENIRVSSIVGRFLEHSRIYYFGNNGAEECYLGSADLMPRNLNRRVEVLFPVERPALIRRLKDEILHAYLHDEASARRMYKDGSYAYKSRNGGQDSQSWFLAQRIPRQPKPPADAVPSA